MAHPSLSPLDAAEMLTARGWVVFPADRPDSGLHCSGSARACRERRCGAESDASKRGKHPAVVARWGELVAPASAEQLREWFADGRYNVAIACAPSGLLVIDEDRLGGFERAAIELDEGKIGDTFRDRTSARGQHWWFTVPTDPETGARVPVGNAPGLLGAYGCDVRGGASPSHPHGGYVIGPGSQHWTDDPDAYVPMDWNAPALVAPEWVITAVTTPGPPGRAEGLPDRTGTAAPAGSGHGLTRWDSAPRYGSAADLREQFARHCAEVTEPGNAFRWGLFLAARDGWRLVHLGLLDEDAMSRELEAVVWRVWHAAPDDRDVKIVMQEALTGPHGAQASPWELSGAEVRERARQAGPQPGRRFLRPGDAMIEPMAVRAPVPDAVTPPVTSENGLANRTSDGNRAVAEVNGASPAPDIDLSSVETLAEEAIPDAPPGIDPQQWRVAYLRERTRRAVLAELDAADLPELVAEDWITFRASPKPSYLVPRMLYRNGLAVIFGAPGSGKSWLALDVALTLATGRQWQGHRLVGRNNGPGMVHYVMAEGRDINLVRAEAWEYYHDVKPEGIQGHFRAIEAGVLLTEPGIRNYLRIVRQDQPDLIVLDTKNALSTAKESAGDEYGAMLRVLNTLREAAHELLGCAVVLVDHSGLGDKGRARGSNAQQAGVHTEIMVVGPQDESTSVYTARVKRNKAAGPRIVEWHWRLHELPELTGSDPEMDAPAVCVSVSGHEVSRSAFTTEGKWWGDELPEPIREVIDQAREVDKGGRSLAAKGKREAKLIMLLLRSVQTTEGLVQTKIRQMVNEPREPKDHVKLWAVTRACALLLAEGLIDDVGTPAQKRYALAGPYTTREMPE